METLANHVAVPGVMLTLRRRNGRTVPVELSTAPLRGGEGKELGALGAFRDLTRVRQLEDRLRRSDRLAALGEMAAGLAHEIKNPLTALLTFSRHLTRRFDDPEFRDKFQAVVPRELERINLIVERLLELSRPPRLAFKPLRLPALLERVLELYAERVDAQDVQVSREWSRDLPSMWVDHESLYRAFVNLVANALDAMPRGGRLTLRATWTDGELVGSMRGGRRVAVEIEDTGPGIAADDLDRVFNPFFSTKDGGTGLGLALTHKIVEEHGGSIDVRSTRGAGATFRIVLPLMPDAATESVHDDRLR
jgi:signal transduction histidine kinase